MNYLVVIVITLVLMDILATVNARATLAGRGGGRRVAIHPHESVVSVRLAMPAAAATGSR
jgi:hypothetical protein